MGNDEILTDDYVADLLSKEAKDCSLKYSTMGMEAYTSSSRPSNKMKPNTRFLRNIIKGTEHHNKSLLAKEQSESQARLQELAQAEEQKRRKYRPNAGEIRGRQLGNITALLTGQTAQKRKRGAAEEEVSDLQKARAVEDARRLADTAASRRRRRDKDDKRRRSLERYSVRKGKDGDDDGDTYFRQNSSSDEEDFGKSDRKRRHRERSRSPKSSPRKHRRRSPLREEEKEKASSKRYSRHEEAREESAKTHGEKMDEDSDPLEDLIGPAPPPRVLPRGRGALRGSSGMDSRFSSDYDPKSDVQADNDTPDDWDEALEALRDRAKWRQQGADRLREAGFTEEQVKKWEKGDEKTIDDVKWSKAGEKREWDRGKDVEQEDDE